jgi:hypothetical protein
VARRRAARVPGRGGDGIQAARPPRARLAAAAAAIALASLLAAAIALRADRLGGLLASVGALAVLSLAYGVLRGRAWTVPWALLLLGGAYAGSLFLSSPDVDREAPLVAAGFLLVAELAYWSLELRTPISPEPGMLGRRAALIVAAALGALVVASVAIVATAISLGGGVLVDLLGVAAAVAALVVVARLAQREQASAP